MCVCVCVCVCECVMSVCADVCLWEGAAVKVLCVVQTQFN